MSKVKITSKNAKLIISLSLIFFTSLLIRLIGLNQSLWLDEATTARVVQEYGFTQIVSGFSPNDFHPPLYYLFMKVWTNIFGYSEIALRMPSVIFSLLTGYVVYLIGKKLFNNDSGLASLTRMTKSQLFGLWAAAFFLFNPLIVYYSQEARMYMMTTFFLTLALWSFWGVPLSGTTPESNNDSGFIPSERVFRASLQGEPFRASLQDEPEGFIPRIHPEGRARSSLARMTNRSRNPSIKLRVNKFGMTKALIMFNLFSILAFVTFYGSIFLIIPILIYLLIKKQYSFFLATCFLLLTTLLIMFPLLSRQINNAKSQIQLVPNWGLVLGKTNLKNLLLIPLKFSIGRISFYPKWLYWGVSGLWTLLVFLFTLKGGLINKFLLFLVIGSLGFGILFSFFTPLLQYFRFLYLIPITSILLALGWDKFHLRGGKWLVLTGFILFSLLYLLNPNFQREDWRSLAKALPANRNIYMVYSTSDPIRYYRREMQIVDLKSVPDLGCLDSELIVIPYTADIHGIDYQKILSERNFKLTKKQVFRALTVETWNYSSL